MTGETVDLAAQNLRAVTIQCITEVTFTNLIDEFERKSLSSTEAIDPVYPAGFTFYGSFTEIAISSGSARVTLASDRK